MDFLNQIKGLPYDLNGNLLRSGYLYNAFDQLNGIVTKYETYRPQTNPRDPKPWESVKRYDGGNPSEAHFNKHLKEKIYEPHVHDPTFPGGVRPAHSWEIPK